MLSFATAPVSPFSKTEILSGRIPDSGILLDTSIRIRYIPSYYYVIIMLSLCYYDSVPNKLICGWKPHAGRLAIFRLKLAEI